jgi:hypothetical protein
MAGSKAAYSRWVGNALVYYTAGGTEIFRVDGVAAGLILKTGGEYAQRFRVATADVNAGLTLLAALAGYKYRLLDAFAIAVGGAAGAVTTVDILGTQATSGVKLVAFGHAALTQSALVRAGSSGGVLLADGASFVANDVNTAITVGKTGSSLTTATSVDISLRYAIDQ